MMQIFEIDYADIRPDENQPRKAFDQDYLDAMADSYRERGQVTPARIRRDPSPDAPTPYIIVDGECRWRVGRKLHQADPSNPLFAKYRAYVDEIEEKDLVVVQFLSNSGSGHTPAEKLEVMQRLSSSGVPRNKLRVQLGITPGQYRLLREFANSPSWLRPYGAPHQVEKQVLSAEGTLVLDDDGRPRVELTTVPPLPLTHLAVLTRHAVRLLDWDREQQEANPEGEHRNVAQATICRIAERASRDALSVSRLAKLCESAAAAVVSGRQHTRDKSCSPFVRGANNSLRIPTTDPDRLSPEAALQLEAELVEVLRRLRAAREKCDLGSAVTEREAPSCEAC